MEASFAGTPRRRRSDVQSDLADAKTKETAAGNQVPPFHRIAVGGQSRIARLLSPNISTIPMVRETVRQHPEGPGARNWTEISIIRQELGP